MKKTNSVIVELAISFRRRMQYIPRHSVFMSCTFTFALSIALLPPTCMFLLLKRDLPTFIDESPIRLLLKGIPCLISSHVNYYLHKVPWMTTISLVRKEFTFPNIMSNLCYEFSGLCLIAFNRPS